MAIHAQSKGPRLLGETGGGSDVACILAALKSLGQYVAQYEVSTRFHDLGTAHIFLCKKTNARRLQKTSTDYFATRPTASELPPPRASVSGRSRRVSSRNGAPIRPPSPTAAVNTSVITHLRSETETGRILANALFPPDPGETHQTTYARPGVRGNRRAIGRFRSRRPGRPKGA